MDKRKLENPLSRLMGLVGKQKKKIRKKLLSKLSRLPMGVILDTPSGRLKDTIVDRVLLTKSFLEIKIITVLYSTVI